MFCLCENDLLPNFTIAAQQILYSYRAQLNHLFTNTESTNHFTNTLPPSFTPGCSSRLRFMPLLPTSVHERAGSSQNTTIKHHCYLLQMSSSTFSPLCFFSVQRASIYNHQPNAQSLVLYLWLISQLHSSCALRHADVVKAASWMRASECERMRTEVTLKTANTVACLTVSNITIFRY